MVCNPDVLRIPSEMIKDILSCVMGLAICGSNLTVPYRYNLVKPI